MGKGSKRRPQQVSDTELESRWQMTFTLKPRIRGRVTFSPEILEALENIRGERVTERFVPNEPLR